MYGIVAYNWGDVRCCKVHGWYGNETSGRATKTSCEDWPFGIQIDLRQQVLQTAPVIPERAKKAKKAYAHIRTIVANGLSMTE